MVTAITGGGNNATFDAVGVITAQGVRHPLRQQRLQQRQHLLGRHQGGPGGRRQGQLVDIIQYRWKDYTGTYVQNPNGTTPPNCAFDNRLCAGAVQLYR